MKSRARKLALVLLRGLGVFRLLRFRRRREIAILTLHGVMDADDGPVWTALRPRISRRCLARHLQTLSRHYKFISLDEAVDMLAGRRPVQPHSLVLTFDDGCRNCMTHAMPILRRYGAPATVFLSTGHVDAGKPYWFDRLDYALQHASADGREVRVGAGSIRISASDRSALRDSYARIRAEAKSLPRPDGEFVGEMEALAAELESESGRGLSDVYDADDWTKVLSWEEVRSLADDGVTFGSHTVDHVRLALIGPQAARDQLLRSKKAIEKQTRRPCRLLSYPSGSFDARVAETARQCGYAGAVTTVAGLNRPGDDPMALRRISLSHEAGSTEVLWALCRVGRGGAGREGARRPAAGAATTDA